MSRPLTIALLSAACVAACSLDWDKLDPSLGGGGSGGDATTSSSSGGSGGGTGGTGGTGGSTGGNGGTGGATGGMGGMGGAGGDCQGGGPGALVSRGLVVRYYLDDAESGMGPGTVADSAPNPLDLDITYAGGSEFTTEDCQSGMTWPAISGDGKATIAVSGTKLETAFDGSKTGTIECVLELDDADPSSSRIAHFGDGEAPGRFTLFSDGPMSLGLDLDIQAGMLTGEVEEWTVDHAALGKLVAHLVLDTTEALDADRARLYINGVDQGAGDIENQVVPLDAEIEILAPTDFFGLGNREIGGRSFQGTLYYCALYETALTAAEVLTNATVLLADDDAP